MLVLQYLLLLVGRMSGSKNLKKKQETRKLKKIFHKLWVYLDKNESNEGKKCRGLWTEAIKTMRTTEFKDFCTEELETAPNDFQIHECERTGSAVSEAAVIRCSMHMYCITQETISPIKGVSDVSNCMGPTDQCSHLLAMLPGCHVIQGEPGYTRAFHCEPLPDFPETE